MLPTLKWAEKRKIIFIVFIQIRSTKNYEIISILFIFYLHKYATTVKITDLHTN
jgi:hypothetical protein